MTPTPIRDYLAANEYPDYESLIASLGVEALASNRSDSYSGTLRMLVRDGDQLGVIALYFGSCSGCDELERLIDDHKIYDDECTAKFSDTGVEALEKMRAALVSEVVWGTPAEVIAEVERTFLDDDAWDRPPVEFRDECRRVLAMAKESGR